MVARENPVSTWYGAILFCSGEGSLLQTRATPIESFEAVFLSGWRSPTPSHKSFHGSLALVRDLCVRGGGRQPRGNRHPFSFTSYLLPFPQKENPFWGGNCSGRLRTSTSSRGEENSSRVLLTLRPHWCIPVSFSHPPSPLLGSCKAQQQRETKETGVT